MTQVIPTVGDKVINSDGHEARVAYAHTEIEVHTLGNTRSVSWPDGNWSLAGFKVGDKAYHDNQMADAQTAPWIVAGVVPPMLLMKNPGQAMMDDDEDSYQVWAIDSTNTVEQHRLAHEEGRWEVICR